MKTILLLILVFFLQNILWPVPVTQLLPRRIFDEKRNNLILKHLPFLTATDTHLIIVNNYQSEVIRMNLSSEMIDKIGEKGEGPGEYILPTGISSYGQTVALIHKGAVSFFNAMTKQYLGRFKLFHSVGPFGIAINEESIFLHNRPPKDPVVELSWQGKKKSTYLEPFVINAKRYRFRDQNQYISFIVALSESLIEVNEGCVFVINRFFSRITRFRHDKKIDADLIIDENGTLNTEFSLENMKEEIIKKNIHLESPFSSKQIDSVRIIEGFLFLGYKVYNSDEKLTCYLLVFNADTLELLGKFIISFPNDQIIAFRGIGVRKAAKAYHAYFAVAHGEEGDISISEYEIKM